MMEHGWEPYQFDEQKPLNNVTATLLQPLELVGDWGVTLKLIHHAARLQGNGTTLSGIVTSRRRCTRPLYP